MLSADLSQGTCAKGEIDPDTWFPAPSTSNTAVKEICAECPVRAACLEYALDRPELEGIWGGASYKDRQAIRRTRRKQDIHPNANQGQRVKRAKALMRRGYTKAEAAAAVGTSATTLRRWMGGWDD
ncbi:WhiB family transcriptional regulator [Demequina globuliformis]|uniref:WhiB family transcriptional regulator n=1 Tax=Demequina globuliformis TaxID=676202 RepID=UPI0007813EE4|nr:WhiB family transcriptional regulator [Demequina globuliformis]